MYVCMYERVKENEIVHRALFHQLQEFYARNTGVLKQRQSDMMYVHPQIIFGAVNRFCATVRNIHKKNYGKLNGRIYIPLTLRFESKSFLPRSSYICS